MKFEIKLNPDAKETKVIIETSAITPDILDLKEKILSKKPHLITGFKEDVVEILDEEDIIRCYAYDGKVYIVTTENVFHSKVTLKELEERLSKSQFVRTSRSDIINLKQAKNFDLSFVGTISIKMINGDVVYVSRRKLKEIKSILGI